MMNSGGACRKRKITGWQCSWQKRGQMSQKMTRQQQQLLLRILQAAAMTVGSALTALHPCSGKLATAALLLLLLLLLGRLHKLLLLLAAAQVVWSVLGLLRWQQSQHKQQWVAGSAQARMQTPMQLLPPAVVVAVAVLLQLRVSSSSSSRMVVAVEVVSCALLLLL
jgi:hypothetical protein